MTANSNLGGLTPPKDYYDRFDPSKQYEQHLFIAGQVLQSAEMNEIQRQSAYRTKRIADALFKDGNVINGGRCVVTTATGAVLCEAGDVYLDGSIRKLEQATFVVPTVGTVYVGVRLIRSVVTAEIDQELLDPAVGLRNHREEGADRLKVVAEWGFEGDGKTGDLYPVYWIDDGQLRPNDPPPAIDSVSAAIARYDRDSAGGTYVISGMSVQQAPDSGLHQQVYTISEGRARCSGLALEMASSMRVNFDAQPFARQVTTEPHMAVGGTERVNVNHSPIAAIQQIFVVKEATIAVTHGAFAGVADPLPGYNSVLSIIGVKGSGSTYDNATKIYSASTDYFRNGDLVDWSPAGAEPATGATYFVRFQYMSVVEPENADTKGFSVTGAVAGSQIMVTYTYYVPRIDRLCMNKTGQIIWVKGVSADYNPWPPEITNELLPLAKIYQTWDANRSVMMDGARMVPMNELALIQTKLDRLLALSAQERLKGDAILRDQSLKKSLFVDPLIDDSMRDDGIPQTGAIVAGRLLLPISLTVGVPSADISAPSSLPAVTVPVLKQPLRTGSMQINPYMAFSPIPPTVQLTPSSDTFNQTVTTYKSASTSYMYINSSQAGQTSWSTTEDKLLSTSSRTGQYLRPLTVQFQVQGFAPNEQLTKVTFDGIEVAATN